MGAIDKIWRWFEPPEGQMTLYRCRNCDAELETREDPCPECGGEVTEVTDPMQYAHWGPYQ